MSKLSPNQDCKYRTGIVRSINCCWARKRDGAWCRNYSMCKKYVCHIHHDVEILDDVRKEIQRLKVRKSSSDASKKTPKQRQRKAGVQVEKQKEAQKRAAEEVKLVNEARRKAEEKKRAQEAKRKAEEETRSRVEEAKRKAAEALHARVNATIEQRRNDHAQKVQEDARQDELKQQVDDWLNIRTNMQALLVQIQHETRHVNEDKRGRAIRLMLHPDRCNEETFTKMKSMYAKAGYRISDSMTCKTLATLTFAKVVNEIT